MRAMAFEFYHSGPELSIPMRGYEINQPAIKKKERKLSIPMRGYEACIGEIPSSKPC